MPDNFETLWLQQKLNRGAHAQAAQEIERMGRALPCSVVAVNGSLVQVKFEVTVPCYTSTGKKTTASLPLLWIPKNESQWIRNPTQIGDVGVTGPADTFLGGISGQGSGVANLSIDYGNLTNLVFTPVAATTFPVSPDANKAYVNGPNGVVVSDTAGTVVCTIDKTAAQLTIRLSGGLAVIFDNATNSVQIGGSGTEANDGMVRKSDLQAALNALCVNIQTWGAANFETGAAPDVVEPTPPTATASDTTFSS